MPSRQNETTSAIRLPAVLAIGFTGHRSLPDEAKSRKLICDYLAERKATAEGLIYGVSSAAAGGDLLFAESCLDLGIPLRVLLPLPQESFRDDFDAETWKRVESILDRAVSVEVTGKDNERKERYYECGVQTVQECQMMLALWDGSASRGVGGTEEIVSFAKELGRPVVWIHSATGEMQIFNQPAMQALLVDAEIDFLDQLPDMGVTLASDSPADLARAWHEKIGRNANQFAPQVRRLASIPILYTAAAAFFSGAGTHMPHSQVWLAVGTVLGVTAAGLPFALRLGPRQVLWARTRTATEVSRSVIALWNTPLAYNVLGLEVIPELTGMLMSLNLLKALDTYRNGTVRQAMSKEKLDEFKKNYRRDRVADQMKYFSSHADQAARVAHQYRTVGLVCTGIAVLIGACVFVIGAKFKSTTLFFQTRWLSVAVSALFQLATVAGALIIVNDCDRRQRRYQQMFEWLREWDAELDAMRTWHTVLHVAGKIERALLVELLEWKSLVRNVTMPRK